MFSSTKSFVSSLSLVGLLSGVALGAGCGCGKSNSAATDSAAPPATSAAASASAPQAPEAAPDAGEEPIEPELLGGDGGPPLSPSGKPTVRAPVMPGFAPGNPVAPVALAKIKLLSAGEAPKSKVRYKFKAGQNERVTVDIQLTSTVEGGERTDANSPPISLAIDLDAKSVSKDGELSVDFKMAKAELGTDDKATTPVADALRAEVAKLRAVTGGAIITSRGLTKNLRVEGGQAGTGQLFEQLRVILGSLAVPFPEEDIGKGAKWERSVAVGIRDVKINQTEAFTLDDLEGEKGKVSVVISQTAAAQPFAAPAEFSRARVDSFLSSGGGPLLFELLRVAPNGTQSSATTILISGERSGQAKKLKLITRVTMKFAGAIR